MPSDEAELFATRLLSAKLVPMVLAADRMVSGQSLYEQFQQLDRAQLAREIQSELDAGENLSLAAPRVHQGWAGVPGIGQLEIRYDPRSGRYSAHGRNGAQYPLEGATTRQEAQERARQLIRHGAVSRHNLFALDQAPSGVQRRAPATAHRTIDGVAIQGAPVFIEYVGGRNRTTGDELQGALFWARSSSGELAFWLQGRETNYVLRNPDDSLITNRFDAERRAREMISNNAATDLRPLAASGGGAGRPAQ